MTDFTDNKYLMWYLRIIAKAKIRKSFGYVERHHIIPRSLGGDNKRDNVVRLTAREHFICHRLLIKFTTGRDQQKMVCAAANFIHRTIKRSPFKITARVYDSLRAQFSEAQKQRRLGKRHTEETKIKIGMKSRERQHSIETKKLISDKAKDRKLSVETKKKMAEAHRGSKRSFEQRIKMAEAQSKRWASMSKEDRDRVNKKKKGRQVADTTKQAISLALRCYFANKV